MIRNIENSSVNVPQDFLTMRPRIPIYVIMRVTDWCNFKCAYCGFDAFKIPNPSTKALEKVINEFAAAGTYRICFSGGEPLLREDIGHLVSLVHKLGLEASLNSNGWFAAERVEELQDLDTLLLSLDGMQEIHDAQRKTGSFERVIEAIDSFRRTNTTVYGLTVLTKNNLCEIDHLLQLADKKGFNLYFQPIECDDYEKDPLAPSPEAIRAVSNRLQYLKKKGAPIANSLSYLQILEQWPKDYSMTRCLAGIISCIVNPDGTVVPCNNCSLTSRPGNAFMEGVQKSFNKIRGIECKKCWSNRQHSLCGSH